MRKTTGISLMLLIFLSLSLIIFALLSLSGATADERLSTEAADRTTQYYQASGEANQVLAQIDTVLADCLRAAEAADTPKQAYLSSCSAIPDSVDSVFWDSDGLFLYYDIAVTDTQNLHVELTPSYPESSEDTLYTITAWQIVNTQDWNPDLTQNLYRTEN